MARDGLVKNSDSPYLYYGYDNSGNKLSSGNLEEFRPGSVYQASGGGDIYRYGGANNIETAENNFLTNEYKDNIGLEDEGLGFNLNKDTRFAIGAGLGTVDLINNIMNDRLNRKSKKKDIEFLNQRIADMRGANQRRQNISGAFRNDLGRIS